MNFWKNVLNKLVNKINRFFALFNYLASWVITISPGAGGVGGLKYLTASSWTYSSCWVIFCVYYVLIIKTKYN